METGSRDIHSKAGKGAHTAFSLRAFILRDTFGNFFENSLRTRALGELNKSGVLRDNEIGFRLRGTEVQLARIFEGVNRNFIERRLTGTDFMDVAKVFDTVWVELVFYTLTVLISRLT
jgi:hypothetical protein